MATDTTNANQIDSANRRVIVWCSVALVVLIGFAMAAYEFYEQLRDKDD